jgi:hypothetical protein
MSIGPHIIAEMPAAFMSAVDPSVSAASGASVVVVVAVVVVIGACITGIIVVVVVVTAGITGMGGRCGGRRRARAYAAVRSPVRRFTPL